jgi:hypothetical protein
MCVCVKVQIRVFRDVYIIQTGIQSLTFRSSTSTFTDKQTKSFFPAHLHSKMSGATFFRNVTVYPSTPHRMPKDLNLHKHRCVNLKFRKLYSVHIRAGKKILSKTVRRRSCFLKYISQGRHREEIIQTS